MDIKKFKKIVRQAGEMFSNRDFYVENKTSVSNKVTSMDFAVEKFLKENLTALIEGSGFLGEESSPQEIDNEYVWVVDPIDGTTNFVRDLMTSCVSVALLKNNQAVLGAVYNPYNDEFFFAEKGRGALLNGQKISVSDNDFSSAIYFTSFAPYDKSRAKICLNILEDVYNQCDDIRRTGSAAIELCHLACGRGDIYFEIILNPWDYAAAALILQEAGGYIGIPNEENLIYKDASSITAANTKENYDKLMKIVIKYLNA